MNTTVQGYTYKMLANVKITEVADSSISAEPVLL